MFVDQTGKKDGESLPQCHDGGENYWTERGNGVKHKQLTDSRTNGKQNAVSQQGGTFVQKFQTWPQIALLEGRGDRQQYGIEIDRSHHLTGAGRVLVEQFALPVGRESVEGDVQGQYDESIQQLI